MTITTNFNVGDHVFVLDNNKVWARRIITIDVWANNEGYDVVYKMEVLDQHASCRDKYKESECFNTKEELLKSL